MFGYVLQLRRDVETILESIVREDGKVDIVVLASRLALIGHKVSIRTAMGGGSGQECFRNLSYEFVLVSRQGQENVECIVDPKFRCFLLFHFPACTIQSTTHPALTWACLKLRQFYSRVKSIDRLQNRPILRP